MERMMPGACFCGLETGGSKIVATIVSTDGRMLATREAQRPAAAVAADTTGRLVALARAAAQSAGIGLAEIRATGWGFGGPVDRRRNRPVVNFHEAGWEGDEATEQLVAGLAMPVFVENDCKVAGLAEALVGSGDRTGMTAYLTLGSGVGGGLVWNGDILASGDFGEGEIGHMCVVPGGAVCSCGRRGCLEAYCSGWGFAARAGEAAAGATVRTPLMERMRRLEPRQQAAAIFAAWPADPFARQQVELFLDRLAAACGQLCLLVAPRHLVLGGGIAQQPWLARELSVRLQRHLPAFMQPGPQVACARWGRLSVSLGAALYARRCWRQAQHAAVPAAAGSGVAGACMAIEQSI